MGHGAQYSVLLYWERNVIIIVCISTSVFKVIVIGIFVYYLPLAIEFPGHRNKTYKSTAEPCVSKNFENDNKRLNG